MRWVYFLIHFFAGFFILWLFHQYVMLSFPPSNTRQLWLEGLIETSYLVAGVSWGNLGWDAFTKRMPSDSSISYVIYVSSRTLAPVMIALPVVANFVDIIIKGPVIWRASSLQWQNITLILFSIVSTLVLFLYRKSEPAVFYRSHGA
jgi:hypothetical protein